MRILYKIFLPAMMLLVIASGCTSPGRHQLQLSLEPQGQGNSPSLVDASRIIMNRLIRYGIPEERIKIDIPDERLTLTINGIDTGKVAIIRELVTTVGEFGFWETFENADAIQFLLAANAKLKEINPQVVPADTSLFSILMPRVDNEGKPLPSCLVGLAHWRDTAAVMKLMNLEEVDALFPRNMFFLWSKMPHLYDESRSLFELHAIKQTTFDRRPPFSGEEIVSSTVVTDRSRTEILLRLSMTPEGASAWRKLTAENINRCLAIVVDGRVISYPRVQDEITGGNTEISGDFILSEAQALAAILNSGGRPLPVKMKITSEQVTRIK